MNTTREPYNPPGAQGLAGAGERQIWVRMSIPGGPVAGVLYPASNRIGTRLLAELIAARLEADGVGAVKHAGAGGLNEALLGFAGVQGLGCALRTVRNVIEELGLLEWAQIAWLDEAELVNRVFHPAGERFDMPTEAEREAMDSILKVVLRAFGKIEGEGE